MIGAGGLGSPVALYPAGVGEIGIVDGDVVDLSNLQRQVLSTSYSRHRCAKSAQQKAKMEADGDVKVTVYQKFLDAVFRHRPL